MTPLMLAVSSEYQNPEVVRLLLEKGADPKLKSNAGETVLDWASKFGRPQILSALKAPPVAAAAPSDIKLTASERISPADIKKSVEKTVALLQSSSTTFMKEGGCAGCHHQQMTAIAMGAVRGEALRSTRSWPRDRSRRLSPSGCRDRTCCCSASILRRAQGLSGSASCRWQPAILRRIRGRMPWW
jgi:FOG: Ankyrin repeat